MSAQKRLSQISVAAIALVVVALPCFAQTENDKSNAASVTDSSAVVAVNRESLTPESRIEAKIVAKADTKTKAPKFSAGTFVKAASDAPAATSITSLSFEPVAVPERLERKQSGGITFVPSVGSKLPR